MSGAETVTINEIAGAKGWTIRYTNIRATMEKWPCEVINRRGDRRFYLDTLPEEERMAVLSHKEKDIVPSEPRAIMKQDIGVPALRDWQIKKASAWADLVRLYLEYIRKKANGMISKVRVKKDFVLAYNAGAYPDIYRIIGKTSFRTLERRISKVKKEKDPLIAFAPRYGGHKGKRSVEHDQAAVLLSIVRSPYQPKKITEIIRIARAVMEQKGIHDGLSDSTYRRWLQDWISINYDQWIFWREGEKGLHNKCLYWIKRDYAKIEVGDILVADGHKQNFETLNPWTGNPKRMTLILWYDMKSNFPCGWEIMPTENTEAINSALRRAILMLGKIPKIAYLDNGKAFSSRFFNGVNFEEAGFSGVFERLGIHPVYAWPYHPQSKPVERFFNTFAELERIAPSYTGTSITEKPPRLFMGEKLHRRIHEKITSGKVPTLEETHMAVAAWFDEYAKRPQKDGHLKGLKPIDVFLSGQGPGVNPMELRELMMQMEVRTIRRRGIKFLGEWYYDPALYGRKHSVTIKYDLQDNRTLLVYRAQEFICEARKMADVHPAADILGTEEDRTAFKDQIRLKNGLKKRTISSARAFLESDVIPEVKRQIESAGFSGATQDAERPAQKEKIKQLPLTEDDKAKIQKEFEALEREHRAMEHISWESLAAMPDMDRYEKLLEYEAQGVLIPKDEQAFMRYFEQTTQYSVNLDYFIEYRNKMIMVHQTN